MSREDVDDHRLPQLSIFGGREDLLSRFSHPVANVTHVGHSLSANASLPVKLSRDTEVF